MLTDGELNQYLTELRVLGRSHNTIRIRRGQIRRWLDWLTANQLDSHTATRWDAVRFLDRYDDPETRASYRAALRSFHSWLADTGQRPDDPTRRIPSVTCPPGDPHPIPDGILLDVLAHATPRQRSMLILGRFAGLRAAEIAAAHADYLQPGAGGPLVRVCGKGSRWRELPAHPAVVEVLSAADGLLYPSPNRPGRPVCPQAVSATMSALLPDGWTCHSLRHAFATEAYTRTRDLVLVQRWMGHARPQTTVRYIAADHNFAAMAALHLSAA